MKSLSESIESCLEREGVEYQHADDPSVLTFGFTSDNGSFFGYVAANEEGRVVRVYIMAPMKAAKAKRHAIAELFTRINQRVALGGFELDMDDGSMDYKTSAILGESELHDEIMEHLLRANWWAMNTFFPAINMVLFGNITPQHAVDTVVQLRQLDMADEADPKTRLGGQPGDIPRGSMN